MLTNDVVALYNALGGGWQADADAVQANGGTIDNASPVMPAALDSIAAAPPR
jgi:hypothetical protein